MDIETLRDQLGSALNDLNEACNKDASSNETSVLHCGLMCRIWSLRYQIAENEVLSGDDKVRVRAAHMLEVASRHGGEWEKRKASAWEKRKLDMLPMILDAIDRQNRAANLFEDMH